MEIEALYIFFIIYYYYYFGTRGRGMLATKPRGLPSLNPVLSRDEASWDKTTRPRDYFMDAIFLLSDEASWDKTTRPRGPTA